MAPDMSDGPDAAHVQHETRKTNEHIAMTHAAAHTHAQNGWEGCEGDDRAADAHSAVNSPARSGPHEFAQPHIVPYISPENARGKGHQLQHLHPGATTDQEVAELEEQARQLALNVGAAEFSPMGPGGPGRGGIGGQGGPHGANGMHFGPGHNQAMDGRKMSRAGYRNIPFPPAMRGQMPNGMPYEMMQYYAQIHNNPNFFGGPGMMAQTNGEEANQSNSPEQKGHGPDNPQVAMGMDGGMHGAHGPNGTMHANGHPMQPSQDGVQGQGGMPPYFGYQGGMNMMPPFGAFGPNGHMYGPAGPFMGNMQGGPEFWGAHGGIPPHNMGMGGPNSGHAPHHGGNGMQQHNGMGHKGMRGGPRERVMQGRMGHPMRGPMGVHDHSQHNNNSMGYKKSAHMGNGGYHMYAKHDMHGPAKSDTRQHHTMQTSAPLPNHISHDERKGQSGIMLDAKMAAVNRAVDENSETFALNVSRVEQGEDSRTTVMVKNIPNKYTQRNLLDLIDASYAGAYDFFYLPIDFKNKCNLGYAFINFRQSSSIGPFFREFDQNRWERFNSDKICVVTYARIQGKQALVSHFRSSRLMLKHEKVSI